MQKELAVLLANKLQGLPFVQILAGLAQTVTIAQPSPDNATTILKRFPVSADTNIPSDMTVTPEQALIPDSNRASIIYFEDYGISPGTPRGRHNVYISTLRLVCWCNKEKLVSGDYYVNTTGDMITRIIERLTGRFNSGLFVRALVKVGSIPPQAAEIFGKYSYDEAVSQYLRPPFDFFAIDFITSFETASKCEI